MEWSFVGALLGAVLLLLVGNVNGKVRGADVGQKVRAVLGNLVRFVLVIVVGKVDG